MAVSAEVLATTRFDSAQSLADTLSRYVRLYNHHIPQRALGHLSPVQALQDWQEKCPRLFKKKVYNLTGLDTLASKSGQDSCRPPAKLIVTKQLESPPKSPKPHPSVNAYVFYMLMQESISIR